MRTSLLFVVVFARLAMECVEADVPAPGTAQIVRARVRGLAHGDLMLRLGDGPGTLIREDGTVVLGSLASGLPYHVEVMHQPVLPAQLCMVSDGTGVVSDEPVGIDVDCVTLQYPVGGYVVGLSGAGLALSINGNERIEVAQDGAFTFPHGLASGSEFTVQVASQPAGPSQTCRVHGGAGMVTSGPVSTLLVDCAIDRFVLSGTVYGLAGPLVLYTSEGDTATLTSPGTFALPSTLASGSAYAIAIVEQPAMAAQNCTITSGGSGVVDAGDVTSIVIDCKTKRFGLGGQVTGVTGSGLVLQLDGYELAAPDQDGAFSFYARIPSGQPYAVAVVAQPTGQTCTVSGGGAGTVGTVDVSLSVTCAPN